VSLAGDTIVVGDRVRVRLLGLEGVVESVPCIRRCTFTIRLADGSTLEREWLQIDLIPARRFGGPRPEASCGRVVEWDAGLAPSCGTRTLHGTDRNALLGRE